jgi:DNA uptake protein ComE-like DNA-binding protein
MKERIGHIAATWRRGSALILTVVLTSLLAIVGVLFVMASRIDKMATRAATENRELTCAVDTVLSQIDEALIEDLPLVSADQEYYDYPDALNPWLADLEPYASGKKYYWRQISNVGNVLTSGTRDVLIDRVLGEREALDDPNDEADPNALADADGDGVPDAKWFRVPNMTTSKGKRFYAAVRIIDNGAMLNMNTGFRLDPNDARESAVDGTSQLHVNVLALAAAPGNRPQAKDANALLAARANNGANLAAMVDLDAYQRNVIWRYMDVRNPSLSNPSPYPPFDVSDELELRYRFLLNQKETDVRVEDCGRFRTSTLSTPLEYAGNDLNAWFLRAAGGGSESSYAYRHIATTYNMDRIITPKALSAAHRRKMVNVNTTDLNTLRDAIVAALDEMEPNADDADLAQRAAQIAANLRDYIDDDDKITVVSDYSSRYYGFERPCIYLSELACRQVRDAMGTIHSSYAIELYRPYFEDSDPNTAEWQLVIDNPSKADVRVSITWSGSRRFHVILAEDTQAPLARDYLRFVDPNEPTDTMPLHGYDRADYPGTPQVVSPSAFAFEPNATIRLERVIPDETKQPVVDWVKVPAGWMAVDGVAYSIQRDISPHKCIRRLWAPVAQKSTPSLGNASSNYVDVNQPAVIQAHPANRPLTNIGELGMIFRESAYDLPTGSLAHDVLLNLADPNHSRLFNYLTVIDPARYPWLDPNETRIPGRININTAPAMVLAQLPWMQHGQSDAFATATDIVAYRVRNGQSHPYRSIGDLMQIESMRRLMADGLDNQRMDTPPGPDITPDAARDDLEERDLIFTRISDLVTVRSDVFTAYILVRIGVNGPQRRVIAILDRSQVNSRRDKVRLLALHLVPDPR